MLKDTQPFTDVLHSRRRARRNNPHQTWVVKEGDSLMYSHSFGAVLKREYLRRGYCSRPEDPHLYQFPRIIRPALLLMFGHDYLRDLILKTKDEQGYVRVLDIMSFGGLARK